MVAIIDSRPDTSPRLREHTFCCNDITVNYPMSIDRSYLSMNSYFYSFINYTNNYRLYLSPYTSPPKNPPYIFEVVSMRHVPAKDNQGATYASRETHTRWFVPSKYIYCEVSSGYLKGFNDAPGFPLQQLWRCVEQSHHATQLFVRLHHKEHEELAAKCVVCEAKDTYMSVQQAFYRYLDLDTTEIGKTGGLPEDQTWAKEMLIQMGLTGDEIIYDEG